MEEVFRLRLKDRNRIAEELMGRFLVNNRINKALGPGSIGWLPDWHEYERRLLPYL